MKCPHCRELFHEIWHDNFLFQYAGEANHWQYRHTECAGCHKLTIEMKRTDDEWSRVFPRGSSRSPVPQEVPPAIAKDYREAAVVLPLSINAAATLARRCLQNVLTAQGYGQRDLSKQIDALLGETDPLKAIPSSLRQTVDAIRNFGNFAAHAIDDKTTLQLIDVDPPEAEWCLDILDEMFDHYYVKPAAASAKKAALDAKLAAAKKPASK